MRDSLAKSHSQRGFTLVELLVVIAIIGILVSLLLPAVQSAREAARRTQCTNNIRQVSLGMLNYESAARILPVGAYGCCWGTWLAVVLDYIEEGALAGQYVHIGKYDDPDASYRYGSTRNLPVTTKRIPTYTCPSDVPQAHFDPQITSHSYVANFGNTGFITSPVQGGAGYDTPTGAVAKYNESVFGGAPFTISGWRSDYPLLTTRTAQISDGMSKTLMASETIMGAGNDLRGFSWWAYAAGFETYLPPNTSQEDVMQSSGYCDRTVPTNPPCYAGNHSPSLPMTKAARSRHVGGVMASHCDASVRFVSNDIDLFTWRALSTSQGEEAFDDKR